MATETIPGPTLAAIQQVLRTYETSSFQTQQDIQHLLRDGLGLNLRPDREASYHFAIAEGSSTRATYDEDFYAWTQAQAALLEGRQFDALDIPHLVEEITSLGKSEQRELYNRLRRLLRHLLKLHVAAQRLPRDLERAGRGWRTTVTVQRVELAKLLRENRTLWHTVPNELADAYTVARIEAAGDLRLDEASLPPTCPWDQEQVLAPDFWP